MRKYCGHEEIAPSAKDAVSPPRVCLALCEAAGARSNDVAMAYGSGEGKSAGDLVWSDRRVAAEAMMATMNEAPDPGIDAVAKFICRSKGIEPIDPLDGGSNYWLFWQDAVRICEQHPEIPARLLAALEQFRAVRLELEKLVAK